MKKILSLLALSCVGMGAWAQSYIYKTSLLSLADVPTGTNVPVVIYAGGNGGYQSFIKNNTTSYTHNNNTDANAIKDGTTDRDLWVFTINKAEDGTITIKDNAGKYWSKTAGNVSGIESADDAAHFTLTLQDEANKKYRLSYIDGETSYNIVRNAGPIAMNNGGTNWVDAQFYTFCATNFVLPFKVSENTANATWYSVSQVSYNRCFWQIAQGTEEGANLGRSTSAITPANGEEYAFCFIPTANSNEFKIYNKATGFGPKVTAVNDHAAVKVSAEPTTVSLSKNGSNYYIYDTNAGLHNTLCSYSQNDNYISISAAGSRTNYSGAVPTLNEFKTYNVVVEGDVEGAIIINGQEYANNTSIFVPTITSTANYTAKDIAGYIGAVTLEGTTLKVAYSGTTHVTYVYKCEGKEDITINAIHGATEEYAAPEVPVFGEITSLSKTGTVEDGAECIVNYTSTLPFEPGLVYKLKVRTNKNVSYKNSKPVTNEAFAMNLNNLWTIERVAGTVNDYKLYNLGAQQYINGNGFSAEGKAYTIGVFPNSTDKFNFVVSGTTNNSLGDHSGSNTQLGEWSGGSNKNDAGSCFSVESIVAELNALPTTEPTEINSTFLTNGETGYYYNTEEINVAAANPTKGNVLAVFENAQDYNIPAKTLNTSKYYRLTNWETSRSGGKWLSSNAVADTEGNIVPNDQRKLCSNDANGGAEALFQFEESDGAYYLTHVNSGSSICNITANNSAMDFPVNKAAAGTFTLENVSGKWWSIKTKTANEWLHQSNWGGINQVLVWSTQPTLNDCQASLWSIEEVESIPVSINAVGYSTVSFPVAVTIPAEVTAYQVTEETANYLTLAEVSGNVAARTALIIEKENGGNVTFAIADNGETLGDNLLVGTTVRRQEFGEDSFYALAADDTNALGVSFKKNGTVDAVPANKGYLPAAASSSAAALYFDFGGNTTAISAAQTLEPATEALYNINGQRVANPTRGIYVKANGQKVFIK